MASLLGRFRRAATVFFGLFALLVMVTTGAGAAPFAAHVMDARTGETLYSKNAETRLHPASLTKMMTLYIAFEEIQRGRLSLDTKVTVSKHAAAQPPSRLGLKPGQKIELRYLIRAAAVKSANDAATAIGEAISGSEAEFAKRMTRTARALGMKNTTFRNANGLTAEGHLSTAHDMSIMGRRLFYDFPQYYNIFSRRSADAGIAQVNNTNRRFLDAYPGADGIKTGYTSAAGFNLTASAERGGKRIIATVFGGTSTANRNAKISELLDIGFGAAPKNAPERAPEAPAYTAEDEALIASAAIDEPAAAGGAGKTIRLSGEVKASPRPRPRPARPEPVPEPVAIAMAEGIEGALAEATAAPAPEGTLEAQAEALAGADIAADPAAIDEEEALAAADTGEAQPAPPEGTLEAQALALASGTAPAEGVVAATADGVVVAAATEDTPRPQARPEDLAPAATLQVAAAQDAAPPVVTDPSAEAAVETVLAEAAPAQEVVVVAPPAEEGQMDLAAVAPAVAGTDQPLDMAAVTGVEPVAGATAAPAPLMLAAATVPAKRRAPIFESVAPAAAPEPEPEEQEVVVRVSTSGGRHFGVLVGSFTSRAEAERALFKTALAESATLTDGLRKVSEKGGSYRAAFLGLTEEQADLACRRLRARAVECETTGP